MTPVHIAYALAQFAPQIIRWISGDKAGDAAEEIVGIANSVAGTEGTGADAFKVFKENREKAIEFQTAVMKNSSDLDKAYLEDRQNARQRDVELAKAGVRNVRANAMVLLDVVGLLACLGGMLGLGYFRARYPDAIGEGTFGALLAQLSTLASFFGLCLRDAHQFEFGSSRGSQMKDEIIARAPAIK